MRIPLLVLVLVASLLLVRSTSSGQNVTTAAAVNTAAGQLPTTAFLRKTERPHDGGGGDADIDGGNIEQVATAATVRSSFHKALQRAIGGGLSGAVAGVVQVLSLMWLRTVINYQYRYGGNFIQSLSALYGMGGIRRLYSGIGFAIIQAPLARFVSTAANDGVNLLINSTAWTQTWGAGRKVLVAAMVVGLFRILLMPIDTCKTVLQIESSKGLTQLMERVRMGEVHLLYSGAVANAISSFLGHYPWFYTYNMLSSNEALLKAIPWNTLRNAFIGFMSSIVSDTVSNFTRVIKTTKQALGASRSDATYAETVNLILASGGVRGLFGRGLKTRILANGLQSILFTVIWRSLASRLQDKSADDVNEHSDINR